MIESISLSAVASFSETPEILSDLAQINFIFGTNGTGKTTISRVIASAEAFPSCSVSWKQGIPLQTIVYNRDFVEKNFSGSAELKGVFTLGAQQVDLLRQIDTERDKQKSYEKKVAESTKNLKGEDGKSGKERELNSLENQFQEQCWNAFSKYKTSLTQAFEGVRNSKKLFRNKVLEKAASISAALVPLADLELRAKTVFGQAQSTETPIDSIEVSSIVAYETDPILKKCVIGKEDVDIAAMIKKLGNSDWVREGRTFYEANDNICPFCQQTTSESFSMSLTEYFNETFESDNKAITELLTNYKMVSGQLQQQIERIISSPSRLLDVDKLKSEKKLLDAKLALNVQQIETKSKEPSRVIELNSIANEAKAIQLLIDEANALIDSHNMIVRNLKQEKERLTEEVWKHFLDVDLKNELANYKSQSDNLKKAIDSIKDDLNKFNEEIIIKQRAIQELERQATSIQPTMDEINELLLSFGFHSFSLAKAANGISYKLVRPDNSDAKETLSEGEKTFVTFLYFYHLIKGSNSESGITTDRVVVFDDPVSSLDSDILFIVGHLIKKVFKEIRDKTGNIKQVFVLTHNVYFHKEVTFNKNRKRNGETFWVVTEPTKHTRIKKHETNPIRTSY